MMVNKPDLAATIPPDTGASSISARDWVEVWIWDEIEREEVGSRVV